MDLIKSGSELAVLCGLVIFLVKNFKAEMSEERHLCRQAIQALTIELQGLRAELSRIRFDRSGSPDLETPEGRFKGPQKARKQ